MFQCDVRQKMINHHKGEDYPTNLIVYFIECIELAHKTESPIENLQSIGLVFCPKFFVVNLKLLSPILLIPTSCIKKLLAYHQCSIIQNINKNMSQIIKNQNNKEWNFYAYGIANDLKYLHHILSKFQMYSDQKQILSMEGETSKNLFNYKVSGDFYSLISLPIDIPNSNFFLPKFENNASKIFISNGSIHHIEPIPSSKLAPIELNADSFWPFEKPKFDQS